jgi:hypothetical protein
VHAATCDSDHNGVAEDHPALRRQKKCALLMQLHQIWILITSLPYRNQ